MKVDRKLDRKLEMMRRIQARTARASRAAALLAGGSLALVLTAAFAGTASAEDVAGATGETVAPEAEAPAPAAATTAETETADPVDGNLRVRLGAQAAIVNGDVAQFQQRHRIPENLSGGIEEFHFDKEIAEGTQLDLDGRAIFDNRDYLLNLKIHNEDKGYFDVGYRQFRTWYDARGGYFNGTSFDVIDPETGVDRGEAWAKGGIFLPDGFKLTMAYRYLSRTGSKSSIEWGDSTAVGSPLPNDRRDIVPSFYELDEQRHQGEIALSRKTETSEIGAGVFYEHSDIDDKRNVTRSPGQAGLERRFTQRDASKSDMVSARTFGSKQLYGNKMTISGAYSYNDLQLDLGGSRIYGSTFHPPFSLTSPNRQQRDEGFLDLGGETRMREHVGNLSMSARPSEDFQVISSLRARGEYRHGHADFTETNVGGAPTYTTTLEDLETQSDTDDISFAEDLELRYTGVDNLVLYTSALWEENNGDYAEQEIEPVAAVVDLDRRTDVDRFNQKYAIGAKVYPVRWVNFSTEYSYRLGEYDYTHYTDSTPNNGTGPTPSSDRYPAYLTDQDFETHDLNFRTTFRLPAGVGLVFRYDWLQTTIDTQADQLDNIQSAQVRSHIFGGTVTYNPMPWWWTRAGVNYVLSSTDTAADNYATPVAPIYASFDNNYVMTTLASGMALDDLTELDIGYNWISADNFHNISAFGQPFGSDFNEHEVGFRVARRINDHTKVAGGYSYSNYDEAFAGGTYNYDAHLITTSVEFEY